MPPLARPRHSCAWRMAAGALALAALLLAACSPNPYVMRRAPITADAPAGLTAQREEDVRFFLYGQFCGAGQPAHAHPVGFAAERVDTLMRAAPPVDDVDTLCYAHDLCYEYVGHDSAACDNAFFASLSDLIDAYDAASARATAYDRDWMSKCSVLLADIRGALKGKSPGRLMLGFVGDTVAMAELVTAVPGVDGPSIGAANALIRRGRLGEMTVAGEFSRLALTPAGAYPREGECRIQGEPTIDPTHFDNVRPLPPLFALQRKAPTAVADMNAHARRLTEVGFRLRTRGAAICQPAIAPDIGARFHALSRYDEPYRDVIAATQGLTDELTVKHVAPASPAASAGLRPGDRVIAVNKLTPTAKRGEDAVAATQRTLAEALLTGRASVTVMRPDGWVDVTLQPVRACPYAFELWDSLQMDAFSNGASVVVTTGMMSQVRDNAELAFVLGRELAHNALGHPQAIEDAARRAETIRGLGEITVKAITGLNYRPPAPRRRIAPEDARRMEREADYVGLYFAARAGYRTDGAAAFLRRLAATQQTSAYVASALDLGETRLDALERAQAEIAGKRARGLELQPDLLRPT
ncbi:MAG: M48 family metalloprotease [Caulobacterales bacterium]|nr:M48 family metalloprotease [Caulobacterales bacterium]